MSGKIIVKGYSKNNRYIGFIIVLFKSIKETIAYGVYDCLQEKTIIRKTKKSSNYTNWKELVNKILSSNDWDINIKYGNPVKFYYCKY